MSSNCKIVAQRPDELEAGHCDANYLSSCFLSPPRILLMGRLNWAPLSLASMIWLLRLGLLKPRPARILTILAATSPGLSPSSAVVRGQKTPSVNRRRRSAREFRLGEGWREDKIENKIENKKENENKNKNKNEYENKNENKNGNRGTGTRRILVADRVQTL